MAEHKFTDEEIIKSLECCANADCVNCPRWSEEWYSGMCADFLPSVLDLFKRQKAEVAREICCKIEQEIVAALESNYKVKAERMANPRIDADEFISYCEGKIAALRGIEDFVEELKKKYTEGKNE